jgi:ABC-type oligopeptide transport system substrate-binding subunit
MFGGRRVACAVAATVLVCGGVTASGASGNDAPAARGIVEGGTLKVNISNSDVQSLDPAIDYEIYGWTVEFATCAKLLNYPDRPGAAGTQLIPEAAAGYPTVSPDGTTYTFKLRKTFRFSDGKPVTAASFSRAIERALSPKMSSPAASFLGDVVGAEEVENGKATRPSGVTLSPDRYTLRVRLTQAAPDFLARMAMNFFCAVPPDLPIDPKGVDAPPGAGPYYVASREVNRSILLKRNPYYRGSRPRHLEEIRFTVGTNQAQSLLQVKKGEADYDASGVPPASQADLAKTYGVNKGRYFAHPGMNVFYLALNTSRGIFRNAQLRKAVNYAIDRPSIVKQGGFLAGTPTDQVLPPSMRGFRDAKLYPTGAPDLARAKALAGAGGKAVLYTDNSPVSTAQSEVIQASLKEIGINVSVKRFEFAVLTSKIGVLEEPYDMVLIGWFADYADPYDFINVLLSGKSLAPDNNVNNARFDDSAFNERMDTAATLSGPARYAAYGKLDVDLMRVAAPWAPTQNGNTREFVSARVGCYLYQPTFAAMDLAAACLKKK